MIKYKVKPWNFTPVEYEVLRETEYSIWFINNQGKEVMERKTHSNGKWYDTFEAAKADQIRSLEVQIAQCQHKMESKQKDLKVLLAMDQVLTPKELAEKVWGSERY